jgi:hypothetical protein
MWMYGTTPWITSLKQCVRIHTVEFSKMRGLPEKNELIQRASRDCKVTHKAEGQLEGNIGGVHLPSRYF